MENGLAVKPLFYDVIGKQRTRMVSVLRSTIIYGYSPMGPYMCQLADKLSDVHGGQYTNSTNAVASELTRELL